MSRGKIKQLKRQVNQSNKLLYYSELRVAKLSAEVKNLSIEAVSFMKKAFKLEDENAKLKEMLKEWVNVTNSQGKHLAMMVLKHDTEKLVEEMKAGDIK